MAAAARVLNISASAVAQQLHALERELGAPLLLRVGRTMRMTEEGARVLAPARKLLRDATDLRGIAEVKGLKGHAMVIAEKDDHYAFHRGTTPLSGFIRRTGNQLMVPEENDADALNEKLKMLEKNWKGYRMNRQQKQEGVEIERTKK